MSLLKRIDEDLIKALKARDELKVTLLRGLKSDIKYKKIDKGDELDDDETIAVLSSAAKKRREAITQFQAGNRQDLVDKETAELNLITEYLPEQLGEDKIKNLINQIIEETGADSPAKIGLVMKNLMPHVKGKADGRMVKDLVTQVLSGMEN
jgi:uncharacterized protein YqeY